MDVLQTQSWVFLFNSAILEDTVYLLDFMQNLNVGGFKIITGARNPPFRIYSVSSSLFLLESSFGSPKNLKPMKLNMSC